MTEVKYGKPGDAFDTQQGVLIGTRLTTPCSRPRISVSLIENLYGFEVECAAADGERWATVLTGS